MSLDPERTPVVVAAAQTEDRDLVLGPLELAEAVAREALGAAPGLAKAIERLSVVNILARRAGTAPATEIATRLGSLGLDPTTKETTHISGNTPQSLVERAANDIAAGRLRATLIVGAEAVRSGRLKPANTQPDEPSPVADDIIGTFHQDLSDEERAAGLLLPIHVYPLFESALAAREGRDPEGQRGFLGRLMESFSGVAASHPHAWFRDGLPAEVLSTPGPDNRIVVEPYVKRLVAFLGGAQGAAIVVTSLACARSLGLADGAMFVWAAASANDVWNPMARPDIARAAGLEAAAGAVFGEAGVGPDDVAHFDLYSCFPSAVQMGAAAVGVPIDPGFDPKKPTRPLTITGGLPYFGGPGNNYSTHAIATLFDLLRASDGSTSPVLGVVTGVGWYMTKHSIGLYGSAPPPSRFRPIDMTEAQRSIDATGLPCVKLGDAVGSFATVEASAVTYDREGKVVAAPVIATLDDGRRVAAAAASGRGGEPSVGCDLNGLAGRFLVGERVMIEAPSGEAIVPSYRVLA